MREKLPLTSCLERVLEPTLEKSTRTGFQMGGESLHQKTQPEKYGHMRENGLLVIGKGLVRLLGKVDRFIAVNLLTILKQDVGPLLWRREKNMRVHLTLESSLVMGYSTTLMDPVL